MDMDCRGRETAEKFTEAAVSAAVGRGSVSLRLLLLLPLLRQQQERQTREREIAQHKLGVWKRLAERRRQEQQQPQRKEGSEAREESECLVPVPNFLLSRPGYHFEKWTLIHTT